MQNMIQMFDETGKPIKEANEKEYLLLLNYEEDAENSKNGLEKSFKFINGRQNAYEFLKDQLDNEGLDPFASFVIVETVTIADRISVVGFMELCKKYFPDDDFDIANLGYNEDLIKSYLQNDGVLDPEGETVNAYISSEDAAVLSMNLLKDEKPNTEDDDNVEDV